MVNRMFLSIFKFFPNFYFLYYLNTLKFLIAIIVTTAICISWLFFDIDILMYIAFWKCVKEIIMLRL